MKTGRHKKATCDLNGVYEVTYCTQTGVHFEFVKALAFIDVRVYASKEGRALGVWKFDIETCKIPRYLDNNQSFTDLTLNT